MSGVSSSTVGSTPTDIDSMLQTLKSAAADQYLLVTDLLKILEYLLKGGSHASTSSTGEDRCTGSCSSHHDLGHDGPNGDACCWRLL